MARRDFYDCLVVGVHGRCRACLCLYGRSPAGGRRGAGWSASADEGIGFSRANTQVRGATVVGRYSNAVMRARPVLAPVRDCPLGDWEELLAATALYQVQLGTSRHFPKPAGGGKCAPCEAAVALPSRAGRAEPACAASGGRCRRACSASPSRIARFLFFRRSESRRSAQALTSRSLAALLRELG